MIDFSTLQGITIPEGNVVSIMRKSDGVMLWQKVTSRLPSAYQEVEWVGTSGTQFIDYSEPITTINEMKITVSFDQFISSYQNGCYMNSSVQTAVPFLMSRLSGSGHYLNFYSGSQGTVSSPAISLDTQYKISYKTDFSIQKNTFTIYQNNSPIWSGTSVPQPDPEQLCGFGIGHNPYIYTTQVGLYGKIYASQHLCDDVVVRDFVPCYRKSDNAIGMYDLITKTFYANAGTGSFTKGANV